MIQSRPSNGIIQNRQTDTVEKCSNLNQGGSPLHHSKRLTDLIDSIIYRQAEYIPNEGYYLDYNSLSDSDLEDLSAQLMIDDSDYAAEATGPDNPAYFTKMLPALITYIKTAKKDDGFEFMNKWRDGITSYLRTPIESLLEDRLEVHAFHMSQEVNI